MKRAFDFRYFEDGQQQVNDILDIYIYILDPLFSENAYFLVKLG
jgi:hypothetical protein